MAADDDDYIYDEATGEWRPASELKAEAARRQKCAMSPARFFPMAIAWCSSRISRLRAQAKP